MPLNATTSSTMSWWGEQEILQLEAQEVSRLAVGGWILLASPQEGETATGRIWLSWHRDAALRQYRQRWGPYHSKIRFWGFLRRQQAGLVLQWVCEYQEQSYKIEKTNGLTFNFTAIWNTLKRARNGRADRIDLFTVTRNTAESHNFWSVASLKFDITQFKHFREVDNICHIHHPTITNRQDSPETKKFIPIIPLGTIWSRSSRSCKPWAGLSAPLPKLLGMSCHHRRHNSFQTEMNLPQIISSLCLCLCYKQTTRNDLKEWTDHPHPNNYQFPIAI
jgi:hypothetical protein